MALTALEPKFSLLSWVRLTSALRHQGCSDNQFQTSCCCATVASVFVSLLQKSEAQLEEVLKEIKSLKELVSSQEKRIIKLEEHIANMAV